MMSSWHVRSAGLGVSGVLAAAGLVAAAPAAQAHPLPEPPRVTAAVSSTGVVTMPSHLRSQRYRFVVTTNDRKDGASLQLVKPNRGYTRAEFVRDFRRSHSENQKVALAALGRISTNTRLFGGAAAEPGKNGQFYMTLYAGRYWALDPDEKLRKAADLRTIHVTGTPKPTRWPGSDATVTAVHHERFTAPKTIPAKGTMLFRNRDTEPHFVVLAKLEKGKTVADVRAFLKNPKGPFPATDQASSAVISPNVQYLWNYSVPKGRYVLLCFWPDLKSGATHAEKGMIRAVTVR